MRLCSCWLFPRRRKQPCNTVKMRVIGWHGHGQDARVHRRRQHGRGAAQGPPEHEGRSVRADLRERPPAGAPALALGEHATEADLATARTIFDSVGLTVLLEESQLDAVTGLSGSGPAYLFLIIEALADAGVKVGLSRRASMQLAAQTVLGSAKLLIESGQHPGMLKDGVTSPGGTAIAGLHTLEAGGLRNVLMNAVEAATRRSRELGEEFLRKL